MIQDKTPAPDKNRKKEGPPTPKIKKEELSESELDKISGGTLSGDPDEGGQRYGR